MTLFLAQEAAAAAAATSAADNAAPAATAADPLGLLALLGLFLAGAFVVLLWASRVRPMNLALGFATTVAMWTFAYLALLQPGQFAGELLFAGSVACVVAGGFVAGRLAPAEASGVRTGLVSATVNLMVIGAFLRDEQGGGGLARPALYLAGLFAGSALLGWVGDRIGRASAGALRLPSARVLLGAVLVANILVMIVLGGLVTSYEAGLAVPDWPNSFGHNMLLYPIAEMKGGIFYEHAHRLFGMLVGATTLAFVAIAASGAWESVRGRAQGASIRVLPAVALAALLMQLFLGASMRHLQLPPTAEAGARIPAWALHGHVTMALVALVLGVRGGDALREGGARTRVAGDRQGRHAQRGAAVPARHRRAGGGARPPRRGHPVVGGGLDHRAPGGRRAADRVHDVDGRPCVARDRRRRRQSDCVTGFSASSSASRA